jgi:hypothetical protein
MAFSLCMVQGLFCEPGEYSTYCMTIFGLPEFALSIHYSKTPSVSKHPVTPISTLKRLTVTPTGKNVGELIQPLSSFRIPVQE